MSTRSRDRAVARHALPSDMSLLATARRLETLGLAAAAGRLVRTMQHPRRAQHRTLQAVVEWIAESECGRRHRLGDVDSVRRFRELVPPTTREELRFDLERTVGGEPDVLVPGRAVAARATMSGPPRGVLVPVSPRCRGRAARDAAGAWTAGLLRHRPRILGGAVLVLPAVRPPAARTGAAATAGTRLDHLLDVLPPVLRRRLAVPPGLIPADLPPGARQRLIMRLGLGRDVRLVVGGDPAELAACFGTADELAEAIVRDVRDGTVAVAGPLPTRVEDELRRRFPPDRDRARQLDRGRDVRDGRLLPVEAWSLEAVACLAQGRTVTLRARLDPWLDPWRRGRGPVVVDLGLLSAEAHVAHAAAVLPSAAISSGTAPGAASDPGPPPVADREAEAAPTILVRPSTRPWLDDDPVPGPLLTGAGPPALDAAFLEYVDVEELDADPAAPERWTFREIDELASGRRYGVFATTSGGLLRIETQDVVEVAGHAGPTPLLRHRGRVASMLEAVP